MFLVSSVLQIPREPLRTIGRGCKFFFLFISVFVFLVCQGNYVLCHFDLTLLLRAVTHTFLKSNLVKGKADIFHPRKPCESGTSL